MVLQGRVVSVFVVSSLLLPVFTVARQAAGLNPSTRSSARRGAPPPAAQNPAPDAGDAVERIKDEGMNRSRLMETLSYLTEVTGPRLTGSPQLRRANEWTRDRLASWGLQNSHLEAWGPFGRGWSLKRFSAEVIEPQGFPLIAYPKAWSPGTRGELVGEVVHVDATTEAELEKYKGRLKGKIVLTRPERAVEARMKPLATRWTDEEMLRATTDAPFPPTNDAFAPPPSPEEQAASRFSSRRFHFIAGEGAAALVDPSPEGDGGTVFVQSITVPQAPDAPRDGRVRPWDKNLPDLAPQLVMAAEHYNRLVRMLRAGERVKMSINLDAQFHDQDPMAYNTVAEIPGTDLKDELVMLGAHLDSWHAGTGATDNAAGVAVMLEAVRILQALKLKPRRTVRVALWTGEEQGTYGSRAYVEKHFARPAASPVGRAAGAKSSAAGKSAAGEYDKLSAYFNMDAGTGRVRGVYLHGNEALRPVFRPWLAPFREWGAVALTLNGDWGSDFVWFEQAGLTVVNFIQDDIEYETRTHHSNMDVLERIQPEDLKRAAAIVAAFVYQTAVRDERLPRKARAAAR